LKNGIPVRSAKLGRIFQQGQLFSTCTVQMVVPDSIGENCQMNVKRTVFGDNRDHHLIFAYRRIDGRMPSGEET
jgi:hypothetical protein